MTVSCKYYDIEGSANETNKVKYISIHIYRERDKINSSIKEN